MDDYSAYICPRSRGSLLKDGDVLLVEASDQSYAIANGIPSFLAYSEMEDSEQAASLDRLIDWAKSDGWSEGLRKEYGDDSKIVHYVTDESRQGFLDLLDLDLESTVLEIGPGLGQHTVSLSERVKQVHALEVVQKQAEFVQLRCREEGRQNVQLACGGDDCRIPFKSEMFDAVIANLVLEWCSCRNADITLLEGQTRYLKEVYRVLKPGGTALISTKNRFALRFLLGKPDEHLAQMRFGSALPRWLSSLLMRLKKGARQHGLLHSHAGLRKMLYGVGFEKAASYWATPEMRYPREFVPTKAAAVRKARRQRDFVQGEYRITRALMPWVPAFLVRQVTPGLLFVAHKPR